MLNRTQKEEIKKGLLKLGLTDVEAQVYFSALQQKESTVLSVSKDAGLSRGTVFDAVEKLKAKGFLAETKKGKKRKIVVENPTNKFYTLLDQKQKELNEEKKIAENILPIIKGINASEDFKPQIRTYMGENGFRQVWDEITKCQDKQWLSMATIETFIEFGGDDFLTKIQEKKAKFGLHSRAINQDTPAGRKLQELDKKYNRETRLAPREFLFPTTEIIYDDKIAMFSTRKENMVLVIESKDLAQSHRAFFEMLWKFLEPKK